MTHRLALAGCGGMGRRHLRAYRRLAEFEPGRLDLAAVIDPEIDRAEFVAREAEELLGSRPAIYASVDAALVGTPELSVLDIVVAAAAHHTVTQAAIAAGLHVLCEKPMAPTVAAGRAMQAAADDSARVLSIAENYRRDPIARLMKSLLASGALGEIRTVLDHSSGGGRGGSAGGWQYRRAHGGAILESGVHNADLQLYLGGPIARVHGQVRLREPKRVFKGARVKPFHDHYSDGYPDVAEADAPDVMMAIHEYAGGALGQWLYDVAAQGPPTHRFSIATSEGRIELDGVRNGRPLRVHRGTDLEPLADAAVLDLVPEFRLDDRTAAMFGGDRLARYTVGTSGVGNHADLNLIAIEVAELLDAVEHGTAVEVVPEAGLRAVALVLAAHESSELGAPVSLDDVLDGSVREYQAVADRELGLSA